MSQKNHPKSLRTGSLFSNHFSYYSENNYYSIWNYLNVSSTFLSTLVNHSLLFKASKAPSSRRLKKSSLVTTSQHAEAFTHKNRVYVIQTTLPNKKGLVSAKFLPIQKVRQNRNKSRK